MNKYVPANVGQSNPIRSEQFNNSLTKDWLQGSTFVTKIKKIW
jgi:hypothetical protein